MKLVVTIDTEEDDWGYSTPRDVTFKNIERLPNLQSLFTEFGVKPTYLITYPIATNNRALSIFKELSADDGCEIGAHCHPWNTPPFEEENSERNSMLCNLVAELQYAKLRTLHEAIRDGFGREPVSFRAGRWAYSPELGLNLIKLGYRVDTSVTPYTDWSSVQGPNFSGMSPDPHAISFKDGVVEGGTSLQEIPATIDYLQRNGQWCHRIHRALERGPWRVLRLGNVLKSMRFLNRVVLSPEVSSCESMIELTRTMETRGCTVANMFFHSSSLIAGLTPYVTSKDEEERFVETIRRYLAFIRDSRIESITLAQAAVSQAHQGSGPCLSQVARQVRPEVSQD